MVDNLPIYNKTRLIDHRNLSTKLLKQCLLNNRFILSFMEFWGRPQHRVENYSVNWAHMTTDGTCIDN